MISNRLHYLNLTAIILFGFSICYFDLRAESHYFIENNGQITNQYGEKRDDIHFISKCDYINYYFGDFGLSIQFYQNENSQFEIKGISNVDKLSHSIYRVDLKIVNASENLVIEGSSALNTKFNYLTNKKMIEGVQSFQLIRYRNIYSGIDLEYRFQDGRIKSEYIVNANAKPSDISWEIKGAELISIGESGELLIKTPFGTYEESKPFGIQHGKIIEANWKLNGSKLGIELGDYDPTKELIIDPATRIWGTYYGGSEREYTYDSKLTSDHSILFVGSTESLSNIATTGVFQNSYQGGSRDGFVAKMNRSGQLDWATYIGGSSADYALGVDVSQESEIYVSGVTYSNDFTTTTNAFQDSLIGLNDAFILKLSENGQLHWSTYFGSDSSDYAWGCHLGDSGALYVVGESNSAVGIATNGVHQSIYNGGGGDVLIARFDTSGNRIWAGYFGGSGYEMAKSCRQNSEGDLIVCGETSSAASISTTNAHQSSYGGGNSDAFLVKFDSQGNRKWGTYIGGSGNEDELRCSVDPNDNIYVSSRTSSSGLSTVGAHLTTYPGGASTTIYLAKFNTNGVNKWATYYGGSSGDWVNYCASDIYSNVYICGRAWSMSGIATPGSHKTSFGNDDAFIAKFDSSGTRLWGTYYGASGHSDEGSVCSPIGSSSVYLVGYTIGPASVATPGTHQTSLGGKTDAFVTLLKECNPDSTFITKVECFQYTSPSGRDTYTKSGIYYDFLKGSNSCDSVIIIDLTIDEIRTVIVDTSCGFYPSPSGKYTYTSSGIYTDTIPSGSGCDSVLEIHLTITNTLKDVWYNNSQITAVEPHATYQWIDCLNDKTPISKQTGQSYSPQKNGSYAVIITRGNCVDTSECISMNYVGVTKETQSDLLIYPNPAGQFLIVESNRDLRFKLINLNAIVVEEGILRYGKTRLDISNLKAGSYYLKAGHRYYKILKH